MTGSYIITKVNISDNQVDKIKSAIDKCTTGLAGSSGSVTIQLSIADLQVENPARTLAFTKSQIN
jgi:hypothetical protein